MDWKLIYSITKDLCLLAALFYTWWSNREKVTARRFAAMEKDVAQRVTAEALKGLEAERDAECAVHKKQTRSIELDLKRVDSELRHLPNHNDLNRIHGRIDEMSNKLSELSGQVKGIGHQVNLVLEEMLKR